LVCVYVFSNKAIFECGEWELPYKPPSVQWFGAWKPTPMASLGFHASVYPT